MIYNEKSAREHARRYGLEESYREARRAGLSIQEALEEWDLWDYEHDEVEPFWKRFLNFFKRGKRDNH